MNKWLIMCLSLAMLICGIIGYNNLKKREVNTQLISFLSKQDSIINNLKKLNGDLKIELDSIKSRNYKQVSYADTIRKRVKEKNNKLSVLEKKIQINSSTNTDDSLYKAVYVQVLKEINER